MTPFHTTLSKVYHYYVRVIWKQLPKFFQSNFRKNLRNKSDLLELKCCPQCRYTDLHLPCAYKCKDNLPTVGICWLWVSFSPHIQYGLEVHEPTFWEKLHCVNFVWHCVLFLPLNISALCAISLPHIYQHKACFSPQAKKPLLD